LVKRSEDLLYYWFLIHTRITVSHQPMAKKIMI